MELKRWRFELTDLPVYTNLIKAIQNVSVFFIAAQGHFVQEEIRSIWIDFLYSAINIPSTCAYVDVLYWLTIWIFRQNDCVPVFFFKYYLRNHNFVVMNVVAASYKFQNKNNLLRLFI